MSAPYWNFEPLSPNAEEHGISEWDQFDKEELGIDATLLREATQNSLDARDAGRADRRQSENAVAAARGSR